jgi:hypothetical protein
MRHGGKRASEKPMSDVRLFSYTSENGHFSVFRDFKQAEAAL